jgi:hypothetical protein
MSWAVLDPVAVTPALKPSEMSKPSNCHWYETALVATTVKTTVEPEFTVSFWG